MTHSVLTIPPTTAPRVHVELGLDGGIYTARALCQCDWTGSARLDANGNELAAGVAAENDAIAHCRDTGHGLARPFVIDAPRHSAALS